MNKYFTLMILFISSVYSLAAVFTYLLHYAAHPVGLQKTVLPAISVVMPYLLLIFLYQMASDKRSLLVVNVAVIAVAIIGAIAYAGSFSQRNVADMYVITYFAIPALQTLLTIAVFIYTILRRRGLRKSYGV